MTRALLLGLALAGFAGCTRSASPSTAVQAATANGCVCTPATPGTPSPFGTLSASSTTATVVSGAPAPAPQPNAAPTLVAASALSASSTFGAGTVLAIDFDQLVKLQGFDPARDLVLTAGDSLGQGATATPDPANGARILVRLGVGASLSVFGTYSPGAAPGPGMSPASVALAASRKADAVVSLTGLAAADAPAVTVYAENRVLYQGRAYTAPDPATAKAFFGNLHSHTGFSDGKKDPAFAWDHARAAGLDFMCVSDHLEQVSDAHYDETLRIADQKNVPGAFVTITGWEWGTGVHINFWPLQFYNHVNVINTTHKLDIFQVVGLRDFYERAVSTCLPDGAVGMFNHPHLVRSHLSYNNWLDYAYDARADLLLRLIHVEGNGSPQTVDIGYTPALDKGWHVSPGEVQDNHQADWGSLNDRRTGVWTAALTRDEVMRALSEGRTFATDDKNATIRLMAEGTIWMGSTVARPGPVRLSVDVSDPDPNDGFARIELVTQGGQVAATFDPRGATTSHADFVVDPSGDTYFWAHAIQTDGDELFSAPIFIDR